MAVNAEQSEYTPLWGGWSEKTPVSEKVKCELRYDWWERAGLPKSLDLVVVEDTVNAMAIRWETDECIEERERRWGLAEA